MKSSYRQVALTIVMGITFMLSCRKKENIIPIITTFDASKITNNSAYSGGNISSSGSSEITSRGICWSVNTEPDIESNRTVNGSGAGDFVSFIDVLSPSTTYHVRAYATNDVGTAYGNEVSFVTSPEDTVARDPDGNIYHFIKIGTQVWMTENLRTTKYADGSPIATTSPSNLDISLEPNPKYEWPVNGDGNQVAVYGRLYTGSTIENNQLCPTGWHVPSDDEWTTLSTYLGGTNVAGGKLKEIGFEHWANPNTLASDSVGFKALPAGAGRDPVGIFIPPGQSTYYWSSTYALGFLWQRSLNFDLNSIHRDKTSEKHAFSVRCIKD
jgi:uncharacterized protein (TIGR02145 family)